IISRLYHKEDMELVSIAVQPGLRKQGIGSCLLRTAIQWASAKRANKVFLTVRISNTAAIRFYQKKGFIIENVIDNYYGKGQHGFRMRLTVAKADNNDTRQGE
ncbi:MAG: GNAT family N-acetyltransferase, partial [Candidatus Ranarchaeia archaeon]